MKTLPTRQQMNEAVKTLTQAGWTHTMSVMADRRTQQEGYGMLFARGEERFWLNKDTIDSLPKVKTWDVVVSTLGQKFVERKEFITKSEAYLFANTKSRCYVEIYGPDDEYDVAEH